jgi:hypothetical protein
VAWRASLRKVRRPSATIATGRFEVGRRFLHWLWKKGAPSE